MTVRRSGYALTPSVLPRRILILIDAALRIDCRRAGWQVNAKRVYRLYREMGLQLRNKTPKRRVKAKLREDRTMACRRNEIWAMDFVHDQLATGRKLRVLTVVDLFSRFSPVVDPAFSYKGSDVVHTLERICRDVGYPKVIRVDQGSEFISRDLDLWAYQNEVTLDFSRPGKPTDNAFIESFNGTFRAACLRTYGASAPRVQNVRGTFMWVLLMLLQEESMTQHFLLSAAARTLSLKEIYKGGEEQAYRRLCLLRWPATNGNPVCPRCAWPEAYVLSSRQKYKCKACYHQFSLTSGTIFASRKLAFVDLLGAIALLVNAAKGMSALQLSRCIDVSYKTAFVLAHKLREALAIETCDITLEAAVEIDGAYFGGHVRPANARADRVDRRLRAHRRVERRSVIALRQRDGRTLTAVFLQESDGVAFARSRVKPHTKIIADETPHWDLLPETFDIERVNHSDAYSFLGGVHINGAESYFARLRRMIRGQHHRVSPGYLAAYAAHAAWLEDHRRQSNGSLVDAMIGNALAAPVSRLWKGYWQRAA